VSVAQPSGAHRTLTVHTGGLRHGTIVAQHPVREGVCLGV
jgi:hypothetical protein